MKKLNKQGFALLEVAVIVIVVIGIAGAGYYIWNRQNQDNDASTSSQTQDTVDTQQEADSTIVKIPELGIQLDVSASIQDLIFIPGDLAGTNDPNVLAVGFLSTTSLKNRNPACTTSSGAPLGTIWKVKGQFNTDQNQTWTLVKQYSDYFIAYRVPGMNCTEDTAFNERAKANITALKDSLNTASTL